MIETNSRYDQVQNALLQAVGDRVTIPVGRGGIVAFSILPGTWTTFTFQFEISYDGGVTWSLAIPGVTSSGAGVNPGQGIGNGAAGLFYTIAPAGATHIAVKCLTLASGSVPVRLALTPLTALPGVANSNLVTTNAILQTGTSEVGRTRAAGLWNDETSTPLAAAGVFTGSTRDLIGQGSGGNWSVGFPNGYGTVEVRGQAIADVAGTLSLEVSRDGTTWRRVVSVAANNVGTDVVGAGTVYTAGIQYKTATRYMRWVYTNGAGAQTYFQVSGMHLSA